MPTELGTEQRPLQSIEPMKLAGGMLHSEFRTPDGNQGLWVGRGAIWHWYGNEWQERDQIWLRDSIWTWLEDCLFLHRTADGTESTRRVAPNKSLIDAVVDAIASKARIPQFTLPIWLGNEDDAPDMRRSVGFKDVVVDIGATVAHNGHWATLPRTQSWFDMLTLPVDFNPNATCPVWLHAIDQWSEGDEDWKELLQRWMGYCLMPHRDYARWLLMYGKVRAGKGCIVRIIRDLIGRTAFCGTDLDTLAGNHGLEGLENARVLCITEVSEMDRKDGERAARVLKQILGQDPMTINPKFKRIIRNVTINAAPMISSNEIPKLPNKGRGLSSKMSILRFNRSFEGKQDFELERKFRTELQGIAMWAITGALALETESDPMHKFPIPHQSAETLRRYHLQNNPFDAFLESCFIRSEDGFVTHEMIYKKWESWLRMNKLDIRVSRIHLSSRIESESSWNVIRDRIGREGPRGFKGIGMRDAVDPEAIE